MPLEIALRRLGESMRRGAAWGDIALRLGLDI